MKKLIRKWLDIKDPEPCSCERYDEQKLVGMVEEAFFECFNESQKRRYPWFQLPRIQSIVERALEKASVETATNIARYETNLCLNEIKSEEFIDKVVERIKRKQVN